MKYFLFVVLALSSFRLILSKGEFGDDRNLGFWNHWLNQWVDHAICGVEGLFPHPQNCQKFYECTKTDKFQFMKYEFTCAPGTVFDIRLQLCVYPINANTAFGCSSGHNEETHAKPPPTDPGNDDHNQIKPTPPDCYLGNCQSEPPIESGDDEGKENKDNDDPCSKRQRCDIPDYDDFPKACGCENGTHCIYDIRMQYITGSPDGVFKRMFGFNGRFPGPTLTCTKGKILVVRVTNSVNDNDEPTSIHWHGIDQNRSAFYDGPQSITQCPIIRNESMTYEFRLNQSGTYWYHSHHSYQYTDGAWGFLIVHNKPEVWAYDDETLISINDWEHDSARIVSERYLFNDTFPDTASTLINGRGTFPCNQTTSNQTCDTTLQQPAIVKVKCGKTYRIRILNSSGVRSYNISIDKHKMRVIETDGVDTVMGPLGDTLPILPAQRYSVLVSMNQPSQNYWIKVRGRRDLVGEKADAILQYECDNIADINQAITNAQSNVNMEGVMNIEPHADAVQGRPAFQHIPSTDIIKQGRITPSSPVELQKYFPFGLPSITDEQSNYDMIHAERAEKVTKPITNSSNDSVLLDQMDCAPYSLEGNGSAPEGYDQLVTIDLEKCKLPDNPGARLCMNGSPYKPLGKTAIPVLFQMIKNITIPETARPVYTPELNKVIRIILNNRYEFDHPWHLHGHTFWVCGYGPPGARDFNATRDEQSLTRNGVRRDTTISNANSWMCITYETENPGAWFFHCHMNLHLEAGLGMTFVEAQTDAQQLYNVTPPESVRACNKVGVELD